VAIWYMYTHAELIDGAGKGVAPFKTDKQAGIKAFVDGTCQGNETQGALDQLGTDITSVYDPNLVSSLANAAALGLPCPDDTCTTWKNRMNADRPHFTGNQLQVPILVPYGGKDTTIPADRMACVAERLDADKAKWTLCYDPDAAHTPIVDRQSSYAADWIAARTLGEPEPAACAGQWTRPACATPPPNEWQ
jgi:pimeloyl-ACP methyl ester carboxylesterase